MVNTHGKEGQVVLLVIQGRRPINYDIPPTRKGGEEAQNCDSGDKMLAKMEQSATGGD